MCILQTQEVCEGISCRELDGGAFISYITHLLYFMHRPGWAFTVIICPLKATREIMAINLSLMALAINPWQPVL